MDNFALLQLLGWIVVGLVMYLFAATGGFDLGAGMLTPFIGRNDVERRQVINTVGPTWDGNQVWLITAGGAIFAIWPRVYAASFSGFYFAFLLVLWALFLRPVSFEYRSKLPSLKWRQFWDWALCIGSFVPALVLGVGVGNLFPGVPFHYDPISLRFFYGDSSAVMGLLGLLNPFSLWIGVICVLMLLMHGAAYLALRTEGPVLERSRRVVKVTSWLFIFSFAIAGLWLAFGIQGYHWQPLQDPMLHPLDNTVTRSLGGWLANYTTYPWMVLAPILGFLGAIGAWYYTLRDKSRTAFAASTLAIFGVLGTLGLSLFPFIMPSSTNPSQSLLVWNATSSALSLIGILVTAVIMVPIIFIYTTYVYKKMWGRGERLSAALIQQQDHTLY